MQYAGGHLKELQGAIKDPISNFGVVLEQVSKRGRSAVGISSGNHLSSVVHPNLVASSAQICQCVDDFGMAVEKMLIKHGNY